MRAPIELAGLYQDGGFGVYASLRGLCLKFKGLAGLVGLIAENAPAGYHCCRHADYMAELAVVNRALCRLPVALCCFAALFCTWLQHSKAPPVASV